MRKMLTIAMLMSAASGQAASASREIELPANGRATIRAELNGQPVTLRVDLDAPNGILLNPAAAVRLRLKGGPFEAKAYVGPVLLKGALARKKVTINGRRIAALILWFDRDYARDVDGVISPALLPYDVVRFRGDGPRAGHITTVPARIDRQGISMSFVMGEAQSPVRVSLSRPQSATNASGGALLEQNFGATRVGGLHAVEIAFGVERPMQRYRLPHPATVGAVRLSEVDVRTTGGASAAEADPDEIVVMAKGKPSLIVIGRDALASCGSITFDRRAETLSFDCA